MLAPISWLKDYVDINVSPEKLAEKLVAIGFEVEGIEYQAKKATSVKTCKIVSVEKHPNADKLRVAQVDIGSSVIQVVTNVPVEGGEYTAVALDGARLADGHEIKRGELRGVLSEGMLCGPEEIGMTAADIDGQKEDDILRFPEGTPLGEDAAAALGFDDVILDVSVTANRPDCNSIYKLAKEVAVALDTECREPEIAYEATGDDVRGAVDVKVLNDALCPRYMAACVRNVKIFPSPRKMRMRLRAVGIRPINNIVDITNYVLTEIGQPMHAFDLRYLSGGEIVVRNADEGEHIVTLDGKDNTMTSSMLAICDAEKPVAVAGIMGGEFSGIQPDTSTIIFESAKFARDSVRRTSRALNLRSDSSARFEKGIDFASQEYGLKRALTLVYQTGSGEIGKGVIDVKVDYPEVKDIEFTTAQLGRILGCSVPKAKLVSILAKLGIPVTPKEGGKLVAHVPDARSDIDGVNDIAEEFIRVYGYSHIKPTLFKYAALTRGGVPRDIAFRNRVKEELAALGLNECITYSFTSPSFADKLRIPGDSELRKWVSLINPLGEALSVMRTVLTHSMLEVLAYNAAHFNKSAALFEIAKTYHPKALPLTELPEEREKLVIGMYGADADYFTLNWGSMDAPLMEQVLTALVERRASLPMRRPILLKLPGDITPEGMDEVLATIARHGLDGVIATGPTTDRSLLRRYTKAELEAIGSGGISGKAMGLKSYFAVDYLRKHGGPDLLIIGAGGVMTPADAERMIRMGADFVQIYSAFIYEGPGIVPQMVVRVGEME